jgi:hypothetical protein
LATDERRGGIWNVSATKGRSASGRREGRIRSRTRLFLVRFVMESFLEEVTKRSCSLAIPVFELGSGTSERERPDFPSSRFTSSYFVAFPPPQTDDSVSPNYFPPTSLVNRDGTDFDYPKLRWGRFIGWRFGG